MGIHFEFNLKYDNTLAPLCCLVLSLVTVLSFYNFLKKYVPLFSCGCLKHDKVLGFCQNLFILKIEGVFTWVTSFKNHYKIKNEIEF